jgi:hypothetical protein
VTYIPENVRGLLGKDVTITCKANGFPRAKITWCDKNGCQVPYGYRQEVATKDGESDLTIKGLVAGDKGRYTCKASSEIGSPDEASVDLTVYGMFNGRVKELGPVIVNGKLTSQIIL